MNVRNNARLKMHRENLDRETPVIHNRLQVAAGITAQRIYIYIYFLEKSKQCGFTETGQFFFQRHRLEKQSRWGVQRSNCAQLANRQGFTKNKRKNDLTSAGLTTTKVTELSKRY